MPCYMFIDGIKQEMDEDLFEQMAEALHQSDNIHNPPTTTSTRWKPPEAILTTSKEIINPFHLSRLRANNHEQIQSIKAPSNQQMYQQQMSLMNC